MCNTTNDLRIEEEDSGMAVDGHKLAKTLFYEFGQRLVKVKVFFFSLGGKQKKRILDGTRDTQN